MLTSVYSLMSSVVLLVTCQLIYTFLRNKPQPSNSFHDVIFFPDTSLIAPINNINHNGAFDRLVNYISNATRQLDLCLYIFSCPQLRQVICKCRNKGVIVRVIIDGDQEDAQGSQIGALRASGIPVRSPKISYHMHHKFVLIDQQILVNGSLNWTQQGILGNKENIIVTNNEDVVLPFVAEFERLWQESEF